MSAPNFVRISTDLLRPRLPELGKIKIGGKGAKTRSKKGKEFQLPVKYSHFVITTRQRGDDGNFLPDVAIHEQIGKRPTELDVRLMWNEPEQNFRASLTAYDGKRRVCEGDGKRAFDRTIEKEIPCTCPLLRQHQGKYDGPKRPIGKVVCRPYGVLSVILEAAEVYGGYYVFRTTSWETISAITAALETFKAQFGFLAGLPLRMVMYPATDTYEEEGELRQSQSYKVGLVVRGSFETARQVAASARERLTQLQLPAADAAEIHAEDLRRADEEEARDIAEEFFPETAREADYEIVDDEGEADAAEARIEEVCRLALEYSDWEPIRINAQVAKYEGRLDDLLAILRDRMPRAIERAEQDIARREASGSEGSAETVEEPAAGDGADPGEAASSGPNMELF